MNQRSHKQKSKWVPASKMKGMTTKRKPKAKKPRRVVLGVGHPWFFAKLASGVDARAMFLTRENAMKVFVVLSEMLGKISDPDYGRVAVIVAARNHSRARYLALKSERLTRFGLLDWPRCSVRLITNANAIMDEGVVKGQMAEHLWRLVPETLQGPR